MRVIPESARYCTPTIQWIQEDREQTFGDMIMGVIISIGKDGIYNKHYPNLALDKRQLLKDGWFEV